MRNRTYENAGNTRHLICGVNPAFDVTLELDALDPDRVNRVRRERREAAGKALNVARELQRLGTDCLLTGFAGAASADEYERELALLPDSPPAELVRCAEGGVRENLTLLVAGQTIKINRRGFSVTQTELEALRELIRAYIRDMQNQPGGAVCVFTGSMPEGMTAEQYAGLMESAKSEGARLVLDTDAIPREKLTSLRPWLIKPNEHELARICGLSAAEESDESILEAAARQLAKDGTENVLLTLGARGLMLVTAEETLRVEAERISLVNTVGAGDRALAGFLAGSAKGYDSARCAALASRCGAGIK